MSDRISSRLPARTQRLTRSAAGALPRRSHYWLPGECLYQLQLRAGPCLQSPPLSGARRTHLGEISHVVRDGARWLIHTEDFDCFVIVNFAPGGLQSLRHLIDLYETARMVQSRWCLQ